MLNIKNLKVKTDNIEILKGIDLNINKDEIHILMGPNGSGKSTLAQTLMGNPKYKVIHGKASFKNKNLLNMKPNDRALSGMFLSFQQPSEIPGLAITGFLRTIRNKKNKQNISPINFKKLLKQKLDILALDETFIDSCLNEGFSGGEKKKMEILQMLVLEPQLAILDEIDSGLDIDALKVVTKAILDLKNKTKMAALIITHYTQILKYINPNKIHIMQNGTIVKTGNKKLALELEKKGYAPFGE